MKSVLFLAILLLTSISFASEALKTNSIKEVEKKVFEKVKKYGKRNVLVVFDIDNTLLKMPQALGSDQWFGWQYDNCIKKTKELKDFCVARNMGELLDIQGQLFALSNMLPSENVTAQVIKNIQSKGIKLICLTSRGPNFRNATERSFKQNGMNFIKSAIGPSNGFAGTYIPKGGKRSVSYQNGIYMTSGQNKGHMLKALLKKTKAKFKAIVFTDDHQKHSDRMQAVVGKMRNMDLTTYRYGAVDSEVNAFKASDKSDVKSAWNDLREASNKALK